MAFEVRPFLSMYSQAVLAVAHAAIPYDPEGNQRWLRERQQIDEQQLLRRHYIVYDTTSQSIVGYGALEQQPPDPPQRLRLFLIIAPGYLRSGAGRTLYSRLMDDAAACKATSLWMREYQQDNELISFMQERGFVQTRLTRELRLTLAKADIAQMAPILDEVATRGIIITSLDEERQRAPNIAGRLHQLYNAIQDDAFAPLTFQDFLKRLDRPRVMPQSFFVARTDDRLIGFSTLAYLEGDTQQALQHWTGILPAYRRQHIATALRLCNIDTAQRLGYQTLITYTDQSDPVLLALNEKLGFHRLFAHITLERTVSSQA